MAAFGQGSESGSWKNADGWTSEQLQFGEAQCENNERVSEEQLALARTIEAEIIPRLMLAHRTHGPRQQTASAPFPGAEEVERLATLVMAQDERLGCLYVEDVRAKGANLEALYLRLLAPAARHLGELWDADRCSFADVTIGLCRLQQIVHHLSSAFEHQVERPAPGRRIVLSGVSGEQHTLGVLMLAEFFRRSGWDACTLPSGSGDDLIEAVRREWFDIVGISVSCEARLERLAGCVKALRRASRNPAIGVMVGGRVLVERPALVAVIGADATAIDGLDAVLQAEGLAELLARR